MKPITFIPLISFIFLCSFSVIAQNNTLQDELSLDKSTIDNQFKYILKKSGNFKGTNGQAYEAVKRSMLITLQAHTRDTLKTLQTKLENSKNTVEAQQKEITNLKSGLSNTQSTLEATNQEKNNMALLGMQMSKTSYNMLMWAIIAGLLALLIFFIYKFKNSNLVTRSTKHALSEIEEEFDEHRRVALEREQKVRRQLQDEINKHKKA